VSGNGGRGAQPPSYGGGPAGPPHGQPPGSTPPAAPSSRPQAPYGWPPGYGPQSGYWPQQPVTGQSAWGQPPYPGPPRRRGRRGLWLGIAGGVVALIIVVVAVGLGTGNHSSPPSSGPSAGPSGKSPPCPATPVAGPAHTLTFPQSIDGYQLANGPSSSSELVFIGNNGCNLPEQTASYQNSQGSFVTIETGHHANLWHSFNAFWGFYFGASGDKIATVPAGPLGGQAGCGTLSDGTSCNWLDNDTYGLFLGNGSSMSQAQTASLMVTFRNAIEQSG
jgi:hypothetical protein